MQGLAGQTISPSSPPPFVELLCDPLSTPPVHLNDCSSRLAVIVASNLILLSYRGLPVSSCRDVGKFISTHQNSLLLLLELKCPFPSIASV